jgi:hypothetical protein
VNGGAEATGGVTVTNGGADATGPAAGLTGVNGLKGTLLSGMTGTGTGLTGAADANAAPGPGTAAKPSECAGVR